MAQKEIYYFCRSGDKKLVLGVLYHKELKEHFDVYYGQWSELGKQCKAIRFD